jgi:hypothetical protein
VFEKARENRGTVKPSFLLYKLTLLWICLFFTSCSKPYSYTRICDFACFGDKIYILVIHVEGINKSSRFSDGVALNRTRERIAIIQLPTNEQVFPSAELVGIWELKRSDFGKEESLILAGTNSCIFSTTPLRFIEFVDHIPQEASFGFGGNKVRMTTGRSFLAGCGPSSWLIDTHSKMFVGGMISSNLAAIACPELGQSAIKRVAISEDIKTIAVQDASRSPSILRIYTFGSPTVTNELSLAEPTARLESVHQRGNDTLFLFESLNTLNQEEVFLLDSKGKEIVRRKVLGKVAANDQCTKIVSLPVAYMFQLTPTEDIKVQVWNPFEDRDSQLRFKVQGILKSFK